MVRLFYYSFFATCFICTGLSLAKDRPSNSCFDFLDERGIAHDGRVQWNTDESYRELDKLIARATGGDKEAIRAVARRLTSILWPYFEAELANPDDALELLQNALGYALEELPAAPTARALVNVAQTAARAEMSMYLGPEPDAAPPKTTRKLKGIASLGEGPLQKVLGTEADKLRGRGLQEALGSLEARDRLVVTLRIMEEMPVADVARHVRIPEEEVLETVERGIRRLRQHHFATLLGLNGMTLSEIHEQPISALFLNRETRGLLARLKIFSVGDLAAYNWRRLTQKMQALPGVTEEAVDRALREIQLVATRLPAGLPLPVVVHTRKASLNTLTPEQVLDLEVDDSRLKWRLRILKVLSGEGIRTLRQITTLARYELLNIPLRDEDSALVEATLKSLKLPLREGKFTNLDRALRPFAPIRVALGSEQVYLHQVGIHTLAHLTLCSEEDLRSIPAFERFVGQLHYFLSGAGLSLRTTSLKTLPRPDLMAAPILALRPTHFASWLLAAAKIETIGELVELTKDDLIRALNRVSKVPIYGMSAEKGIRELTERLAQVGLAFKP